jgi:hypothetical protein
MKPQKIKLHEFGFELGIIYEPEYYESMAFREKLVKTKDDYVTLTVEKDNRRITKSIVLPKNFRKEIIMGMYCTMITEIFDVERITGLQIDWDHYKDLLENI